jgi:hypothetical protein
VKAHTFTPDAAAREADLLAWNNLGKAFDDRAAAKAKRAASVIECRWLKHGDSVPEGWSVSSKDPAILKHHGAYCVLIERTVSA